MKYRRLGAAGPEVSAIGLGCMGLSGDYGPSDPRAAQATIHHALDIGINLLNTADKYGDGENERLIGRAIRDRRDRVVIATKFGTLSEARESGLAIDGRPENVPVAADACLARLGIDYVDIFQLSRIDPDVPVEDTVGAMARLVETGKVRYIGLSEAAAQTIRRAHAVHPLTTLESEFSLWTRDAEAEILPACRELGIGYLAYSPLSRGLLTATVTDMTALAPDDRRHKLPRFQDENLKRNLDNMASIEAIAADKSCTPAQLALAWILAQGETIVPIPGTKRRARVDENAAAADIELTDDDLARLGAIAPPGIAAGERYPPHRLATVER